MRLTHSLSSSSLLTSLVEKVAAEAWTRRETRLSDGDGGALTAASFGRQLTFILFAEKETEAFLNDLTFSAHLFSVLSQQE